MKWFAVLFLLFASIGFTAAAPSSDAPPPTDPPTCPAPEPDPSPDPIPDPEDPNPDPEDPNPDPELPVDENPVPEEEDPTGAFQEVMPELTAACGVEDGFVPQADKQAFDQTLAVTLQINNFEQRAAALLIRRNNLATFRTQYPSDPWVELKDYDVLGSLIEVQDASRGFYWANRCQCLNRAAFKQFWLGVTYLDATYMGAVPETILMLGDAYASFYVARIEEYNALIETNPVAANARKTEASKVRGFIPYTYKRIKSWPGYGTTVGARLVGWEVTQVLYPLPQ